MNKGINVILGIVIVGVLLVASGAVYTVDETQQAVITQFGKLIGDPKLEAGLYFKIPFVQTVNYFDKRILQWDGDANQMPTLDKRFIWVDTMARWKIVDPLKFMQSVNTEMSAQARLDDIIDASTRVVISRHNLIEAIRSSNRLLEADELKALARTDPELGKIVVAPIKSGRKELALQILERASEAVPNYGIELVDVKIKRINYIQQVQNEVYNRMIEERLRAAQKFRSEGKGKKAEIEGQVRKELAEIQSGAYRKSEEIKGKADAEAIKIYADAYNKDPDFYSFVKTLETYKKTIDDDTTLLLSTDNEFYNQLSGSGGNNNLP